MHEKKLFKILSKQGNIIPINSLNDIPKTDYIYTVVNGGNILQIGKSTPTNGGRLKKVFKGSIVGKHNKAFICGLYPSIVNRDNEYFAIALNKSQDKAIIEQIIHLEMGVSTNMNAATLIDDCTNLSIPELHTLLWQRFKKGSIYNRMDSIEKQMALELFELVTLGTTRIKRTSGEITSSKQADNLEGNILKCVDKRYLTTIWLMMCDNYFRYGNKHSINRIDFALEKKRYDYQEKGIPFEVLGHSR